MHTMHKNYIWTIIAIIIIALGIIFLGSKRTVAPTDIENETVTASQTQTEAENPTETPAPMTATVVYTDAGFSPQTLTIAQGGSVTFINQTTAGKMSVASDEHPAHTIYPEFDQYKTSARGQKEFTFTFTKSGTWNYHDHIKANFGGTVIVK